MQTGLVSLYLCCDIYFENISCCQADHNIRIVSNANKVKDGIGIFGNWISFKRESWSYTSTYYLSDLSNRNKFQLLVLTLALNSKSYNVLFCGLPFHFRKSHFHHHNICIVSNVSGLQLHLFLPKWSIKLSAHNLFLAPLLGLGLEFTFIWCKNTILVMINFYVQQVILWRIHLIVMESFVNIYVVGFVRVDF